MRRLIPLLAVLLGGCAHHYRIVAYVTPRADISRISAEKLTHINYAFGKVGESGEVILSAVAPAQIAQLQALKARNPHLKVILSIGGWGADNFSDAAFNQFTRDRFTKSAMSILKEYALDGIDLDWEYPGQPGPGIKYRPEDKEDFTLLLRDLHEQLDALSDARGRHGADRYSLSIATAGGLSYFQHTEMDRLHNYVDWINIMGYDFAGEWSKTTAHHAALYETPPAASSVAFVRQHLGAGIPSRKLVLGVPFYGRAWCGVDPSANGLRQPMEGYAGSIPYSVLETQYIHHGFERHWDRAAHAPYLWNPQSATFISYEDPTSLRDKARFVKRNHLGGIMFWEMSHDPYEVLLNALYMELR